MSWTTTTDFLFRTARVFENTAVEVLDGDDINDDLVDVDGAPAVKKLYIYVFSFFQEWQVTLL